MKDGFKSITGLDTEHNEQHRLAFMLPETIYITNKLPTLDSLKLGEPRIYFDGTNYWLYTKLAKEKLARIQWTII